MSPSDHYLFIDGETKAQQGWVIDYKLHSY